MKDFLLTVDNIKDFTKLLGEELRGNSQIVVTTKTPQIGKWGMARIWRAWMSDTATWMASQGATMPLCIDLKTGKPYGKRAFSSNDAHDLFTSQWLGLDVDGTRLSWAKDPHDGMRLATKGERFLAMQKHEAWCTERGIKLYNPRKGEYSRLTESNNAEGVKKIEKI